MACGSISTNYKIQRKFFHIVLEQVILCTKQKKEPSEIIGLVTKRCCEKGITIQMITSLLRQPNPYLYCIDQVGMENSGEFSLWHPIMSMVQFEKNEPGYFKSCLKALVYAQTHIHFLDTPHNRCSQKEWLSAIQKFRCQLMGHQPESLQDSQFGSYESSFELTGISVDLEGFDNLLGKIASDDDLSLKIVDNKTRCEYYISGPGLKSDPEDAPSLDVIKDSLFRNGKGTFQEDSGGGLRYLSVDSREYKVFLNSKKFQKMRRLELNQALLQLSFNLKHWKELAQKQGEDPNCPKVKFDLVSQLICKYMTSILQTHPFPDGNARFAYFLTNIILHQMDLSPSVFLHNMSIFDANSTGKAMECIMIGQETFKQQFTSYGDLLAQFTSELALVGSAAGPPVQRSLMTVTEGPTLKLGHTKLKKFKAGYFIPNLSDTEEVLYKDWIKQNISSSCPLNVTYHTQKKDGKKKLIKFVCKRTDKVRTLFDLKCSLSAKVG